MTRQFAAKSAKDLDLSLDHESFVAGLLRALTGTLEDVLGLEEASDFISIVGGTVGKAINKEYKTALQVDRLTQEQVTEVLIDLKRRIGGDFFVIEEDREKIVLGNRRCPFGARVHDRPSLCMMTSNVFGHIVAENLGYATVDLQETIASGAHGCRVVIYLTPTPDADKSGGRSYRRVKPIEK